MTNLFEAIYYEFPSNVEKIKENLVNFVKAAVIRERAENKDGCNIICSYYSNPDNTYTCCYMTKNDHPIVNYINLNITEELKNDFDFLTSPWVISIITDVSDFKKLD